MNSAQPYNIVNNELRPIGELIKERNIVLKGADVLTTQGFTQVPNHILRSQEISPGAKLTYAMLLSYAWNNDYCFPGQDRLAQDMGITRQSANTHIQELHKKKFIKVSRRGQGKVNIYELNLAARRKKGASS